MKDLRKISLKLLLLFITCFHNQVKGREQIEVITKKKIDSLQHLYEHENSLESYHVFLKLKKWSKKINYTHGLHNSYINLMLHHGYLKRIDSFHHYSKKLNKLTLVTNDWLLTYNYFVHKGNIFLIAFGSADEAMLNYLKAYESIPNENKYITEKAYIESYMAICYIDKKLYDKAIKILTEREKDTTYIKKSDLYILYHHLGDAYQHKKMVDKSFYYYNKSLQLATDEEEIIAVKNNITYNYFLQKKHKKAIDSALNIRKILQENHPDYLSYNSAYLSTYYNAIGNIDKAIFYIKKALKDSLETPTRRAHHYQQLSEYYEQQGNIKLSLQVKKNSSLILDSIRIKEQEVMSSFYDKKFKKKDTTLKSKKESLFISGLTVLLLGSIAYFFIRKQRKASKTPDINKEALKEVIYAKENQLSAIRILQKERAKELTSLKNSFIEATKKNNTIEIKKLIQDINKLSKVLAQNNDINNVQYSSEQHMFIYQLKQKHPELSNTDLKHCLFIYIGLSLKVTAQALNISVNTVKNARYRAKSKIKIPKNNNLQSYLLKIIERPKNNV